MTIFDTENRKTAETLIIKAQKMKKRKDRKLFFNAALLSVYGWQMSIPVLLGIFIGRIADKHIPVDKISWTLNCIIIGFIIGILNANYWARREGIIPQNTNMQKGPKK